MTHTLPITHKHTHKYVYVCVGYIMAAKCYRGCNKVAKSPKRSRLGDW